VAAAVVAVAVAGDEDECAQIKHDWDEWKSGVPIAKMTPNCAAETPRSGSALLAGVGPAQV